MINSTLSTTRNSVCLSHIELISLHSLWSQHMIEIFAKSYFHVIGRSWESAKSSKLSDGNLTATPTHDSGDELPTGFDSDPESKADDEQSWEDWNGPALGAVCLFCPANYSETSDLLTHMTSIHDFDFQVIQILP